MKTVIYAILKPFNWFFSRSFDTANRPVVYPRTSIPPGLLELEQNYAVIKAEYLAVRGKFPDMPKYHEVDGLQRRISGNQNSPGSWRVLFFEAMGRVCADNRRQCPETAALISSIPDVFQAQFSILDANTTIPAHRSPYWGYLRYHLALEVPKDVAPRMRVKDQWIHWHEGNGFLFDDTWEHEVQNSSPSRRAVLIVDVLRPMKGLPTLVNKALIFVMKHTYARGIVSRSGCKHRGNLFH